MQGTHIGADATIGPWTYLRPGNELGTGTKAGAFVEMKNAHIGDGTKVPHLSYVGDADLGEHTNIGGGTITANYDGVHKHHTHIGSNVHIGARRPGRRDGLLREHAARRRGLEARLGALIR